MAVYAVSNLNGNWNLWNKIKNFLNAEDTLYVLGNVTEASDDGWWILKDCLTMPNIHLIKGEHEARLVNFWKHNWQGDKFIAWKSKRTYGQSLWEAMNSDKEDAELILKALEICPIEIIYTNPHRINIRLSHFGPGVKEFPTKPYGLTAVRQMRDYLANPTTPTNDIEIHGHFAINGMTMSRIKDAKVTAEDTILRYHKVIYCITGAPNSRGKVSLLNLDNGTAVCFDELKETVNYYRET